MAPKTIATPTVSFSTLAKLMGAATPIKVKSMLRDHKYPAEGPKRSYQNAQKQVISHLVDGTSFDLTAANLRDHEKEALAALKSGLGLPKHLKAKRPRVQRPWAFEGVNISVFPDVLLTSDEGHGGLKVHFGKDPLQRGVGTMMAALLHFYFKEELKQPETSLKACLVQEARTGNIHVASRSTRLLDNVSAACQMISAMWPNL